MKLRSMPIIGGLFYAAPQNYLHNVWQSKLGHQVVRYFYYNFLYAIRVRPKISLIPQYVEKIKKDGIIEWPDFFTEKEWNTIKAEFELLKPNIELKPYYNKKDPGIIIGVKNISNKSETFRLISSNKILDDCAGYIVHKDIKKCLPSLSYMVIKRDPNMEYDDDVENILHSDTFYPTAKAFVYLSEVNNDNAPYIFAKGSQKLSFKRALYEYSMSLRVANLEQGRINAIPKEAVVNRGGRLRNILTQRQRKALGIVESEFKGKENTVIMSNNRGFHRRGDFSKGATREIILVNYRYASTNLTRRLMVRLYNLLSPKESGVSQ